MEATLIQPAGITCENLERVRACLRSYTFRASTEKRLQDAIAMALSESGLGFAREVVAGADRFDFVVDGGVVVEVKIKGSYSEAVRQGARYGSHEFVRAVILATTKRWRAPAAEFEGVQVEVIHLRRRGL